MNKYKLVAESIEDVLKAHMGDEQISFGKKKEKEIQNKIIDAFAKKFYLEW